MIKVNFDLSDFPEQEVNINHFPDGTQRLNLDVPVSAYYCEITWKYSSDEEMATLMYIVGHIREKCGSIKLALVMKYIPNARMDRVKNDDEVFTLKYFCKFINMLKFDKVYVTDPHSHVSEALIDNIVIENADCGIDTAIDKANNDFNLKTSPIIFFPDSGAMKRYSNSNIEEYHVCYGEKIRDWKTGTIKGLEVKTNFKGNEIDLKGKDVFIIDDIISYGGTMFHSISKLKELGVNNIFIYCSHLENSVLDKEKGTLIKYLDNGTVNKLYTQDTLFSLSHEKIHIMS